MGSGEAYDAKWCGKAHNGSPQGLRQLWGSGTTPNAPVISTAMDLFKGGDRLSSILGE